MDTEKSFKIARFISDGLDPVTGERVIEPEKPAFQQAAPGIEKQPEHGAGAEDEDSTLEFDEAVEIVQRFVTEEPTREEGELFARPVAPERIEDVLRAVCLVLLSKAANTEAHAEHIVGQLHAYPAPESLSPRGGASLQQFLDEIEKQEILRALEETRFNRTAAARRLGITFRSMRYRMERLDIN